MLTNGTTNVQCNAIVLLSLKTEFLYYTNVFTIHLNTSGLLVTALDHQPSLPKTRHSHFPTFYHYLLILA